MGATLPVPPPSVTADANDIRGQARS